MHLLDPKATDLIAGAPVVGDFLICGGCGCPNIVTIEGTKEATEADLLELSPEEQRDMTFAIRAVKRHIRNQ